MKMYVFFKQRWLVLLFIVVLFPVKLHAAQNLSVRPRNGGNTLRLGRVDTAIAPQEEVRVSINTNNNQQYQIYQKLLNPLVNEKGSLAESGSIVSSALNGSNDAGTLYAQQIEPLRSTDQLLYSSSANGNSDSFTVVYSVNKERIRSSGTYRGTIEYTLRPVGSGDQTNVFLDISLEAENHLDVRVKTSTGLDSLTLEPKAELNAEDYVQIAIKGNSGDVSVFQTVELMPQNELFEPVPAGLIRYRSYGPEGAEIYPQSDESLSLNRERLFVSDASEETLWVYFSLDPELLDRQKSGTYKGHLVYSIETGDKVVDDPVDLTLTIPPSFHLDVELPPEGIHFANLLPTSEPQFHSVDVSVQSNLGRPYAVTQVVGSPLTNSKGDIIEPAHFTLKTEPEDEVSGELAGRDFMPVEQGETLIYLSDPKGAPVHFKVIYRLQAFPQMEPGNYTTGIKFSLEER